MVRGFGKNHFFYIITINSLSKFMPPLVFPLDRRRFAEGWRKPQPTIIGPAAILTVSDVFCNGRFMAA